jgi:hypothetical protein
MQWIKAALGLSKGYKVSDQVTIKISLNFVIIPHNSKISFVYMINNSRNPRKFIKYTNFDFYLFDYFIVYC